MFEKDEKKFEEKLKKHKYLYKIAFALHLSSSPLAFFSVIIVIIIALASIFGYIYITNTDELIVETDELCQSITDFIANRELERPSVYNYDWGEMDQYNIDTNDFDEMTKSMYKSRFSNDVLDLYNEYEKKGIDVDSIMYDESLNPTNLYSIYDTISYLKILKGKL